MGGATKGALNKTGFTVSARRPWLADCLTFGRNQNTRQNTLLSFSSSSSSSSSSSPSSSSSSSSSSLPHSTGS
ncbi:hypothetical protein SprV_0301119900 [Sparganum proliferum]